jgi:hypothetical protein
MKAVKETFKYIFMSDDKNYEGVARYKIYLLRLLFLLTFLFVGKASWTYLLTYKGSWDPLHAVAFCVWAAYATLSVLGLRHTLKMLPIILFQIFYKVLWLIIVAYPLWSTNQLEGSPAEELTYTFLWIVLAIVALPWKYAFKNYIFEGKKDVHIRTVQSA